MTAGFTIVIWIRFSETGRTGVLTDDSRSLRLRLGLNLTLTREEAFELTFKECGFPLDLRFI